MRFGQSVFSSASSSPPPSTALSSGFWRCLFGGRLPLKLYCLHWFIAVFTDKPTPRNTFPSLNLRHCSPQAQAFCSSAHLPGLSLRLPSPAPLRRECSECSLVVVSRGLSAAKGDKLKHGKMRNILCDERIFYSSGPEDMEDELFSAVNRLSFMKLYESDLYIPPMDEEKTARGILVYFLQSCISHAYTQEHRQTQSISRHTLTQQNVYTWCIWEGKNSAF